MKGQQESLYFAFFMLMGLIMTAFLLRHVAGIDTDEVQAAKLALTVVSYVNSLSAVDQGSVTLTLEKPYDIEIITISLADLDRFSRDSRIFTSPGQYVAVTPYQDGKPGKRGPDVRLFSTIEDVHLKSVRLISILKSTGKVTVTGA
ncbi:MAG: hypothetical protein HY519_03260 [Candidatus Aenigmarchaeota archaeon]|nr:hypothetical protein [Candidatus Aenigmarchaeota archaeon]